MAIRQSTSRSFGNGCSIYAGRWLRKQEVEFKKQYGNVNTLRIAGGWNSSRHVSTVEINRIRGMLRFFRLQIERRAYEPENSICSSLRTTRMNRETREDQSID